MDSAQAEAMGLSTMLEKWVWCLQPACLPDVFYDWQTLIGAGVALLAAFIAARAVRGQIDVARQQEVDRIAAKRRAARATLPLALSILGRYSEDVAVTLSAYQQRLEASRRPAPGVFMGDPIYKPPTLPGESIPALERMIEVADPRVAERLASLIRAIQILSGRADEKIVQSSAPNQEITSALVDAGRTLAIANSVFAYARGWSETVEVVTWEEVRTALLSIVLRHRLNNDFSDATKLTALRESDGKDPLFDRSAN